LKYWRSTQSCSIWSLLEIPNFTGIYREFPQTSTSNYKFACTNFRHSGVIETKFPLPIIGNFISTFVQLIAQERFAGLFEEQRKGIVPSHPYAKS
jgi:hypothetical protein